MPFLLRTPQGQVLTVFTKVGCDPEAGTCEHRLTEVVVLEGEHHYEPEPMEAIDEDWE